LTRRERADRRHRAGARIIIGSRMRRAAVVLAALTLPLTLIACSAGGGSPIVSNAPSLGEVATGAPPSPEVSSMPSTTGSAGAPSADASAATGPFQLTSTAFTEGGKIPREVTCDGPGTSPQLAWTGVPSGTAALVLLVDDPDAHDFVHWIVLDLPGSNGELAAGLQPGAASPQQGSNDFGKTGWGGPCPPSGTHHYRFTLTALSAPLGLEGHPGGDAVRKALRDHESAVLDTAVLTGTYQRG
jgi:Raf kinase inhibitor-like YbhB/YbcL family protein